MIDKIDALLLHYAFDFHVDISRMLSDDFSELVNKPYHHLSQDELIARLLTLYNNELISFNLFAEDEDLTITLVNWSRISQLKYWLTPQGGKIWESLYCPDWNKYISYTEEIVSDSQMLVIIKSEDYANVLNECKSEQKIIELVNWYPFYWKKLESGYIFFDLLPSNKEETHDLSIINLKYVKWHLDWNDIQL